MHKYSYIIVCKNIIHYMIIIKLIVKNENTEIKKIIRALYPYIYITSILMSIVYRYSATKEWMNNPNSTFKMRID